MSARDDKWTWVGGERVEVVPDARLTALVEAIEDLRADDPGQRLPAELGDDLVQLRHACDLLELEFAARAAAFAATDEYEQQGYLNPTHWMRRECRMSHQAAVNAVAVGEQAELLPQSTAAVQAGRIGFAHLALVAGTAQALRESSRSSGFEESRLLAQAEAHSVGRFRHDCAHARHAADAPAYLAAQVDLVEARSLELMPRGDGALILKGFLDAEGGASLRTALEPLACRSGAADDRGRERRLADALVELAGHHLDAGWLPQRAGQRPHLQVTASLATVQGQPGAPGGELEFSPAPIAAATVQRLACDAGVTRVLLGPDSAVVDVGRSRRLPSAPTRRALAARDRGCVWPGCERTASWTSAHHLRHWGHDGPTDLANLALVCYRHHWLVHEGGWQLARGGDQRLLAIPPDRGHAPPGHVPRARAPDPTAALWQMPLAPGP